LVFLPISAVRPVQAAGSLELYATFHAMGVIAHIDVSDDPDQDTTASVTYRISGSGPYQEGFPLSRISETRFVGSLFWLAPGTAYDVSVTFSDPDGGPLHGVTISNTVSTREEIVIPSPSDSHFVSPAGSGTTCSMPSPCSLAEGISQAQPGDEVVLRGGTYFTGGIGLPRSGIAGSPIVIRSYEGENAVLDGADPSSFTWTDVGEGVYRTTVNVAGTHLVIANDMRLFPYDDLTGLETLNRDNTPGYYATGTTLYVHLAGGANPSATTVVVSRYGTAFTVVQDHIYFLDLTFRHYGQGSYPKTIYFYNASDNLVQNCTFESNDIGIGIKYDSHRNVVEDNHFYDTIFDWPWTYIKQEGGIEDGGIVFYDPATGRGNVIRRNTFHDDFDGFNACPSTTAATTNETDVYLNTVYRMGDDGIETDGQCSNVRIWSNAFHDVLMGISLAPVYDGPVYAIRNLIYRTGVGNNDYSGSPFKFNSGYAKSGAIFLFHNTCDAALPGNNGVYIKSPGSWELVYARNNIWAGTDYAIDNYNTSQPVDLDYDNLWNDNSGDLVRWDSARYATLGEFTAGTGQEPHGLSVEPSFVDPASGDYSLAFDSGLVDMGVLIPGINDGFTGFGPDIGAYEYEGPGFWLSIDPAIRAVSAGRSSSYTIAVLPTGIFTAPVSLRTYSPHPSLTLSLLPTSTVFAPDQVTLVFTDAHTAPLLPGLWHTLQITGFGDGLEQTVTAGLLVGGARVFLPTVMRSEPR
jgi:parallel beta-helix repeat protein